MRLGEVVGGSFGSIVNSLLSGDDDAELDAALEQASLENVGIERAFTGFFKRANQRGFDVIVNDILSETYRIGKGKGGNPIKVKVDPNSVDLFDLMALVKWVLMENYSGFFMKSGAALLAKASKGKEIGAKLKALRASLESEPTPEEQEEDMIEEQAE